MKFKDWAIEQHVKTNHYYNDGLPYKFHLQMVVTEANNFKHLIPRLFPYYLGAEQYSWIINAAWGHDLIEDCRVTYNDVKQQSNGQTADIIYAVTNYKGKSRKDRANENYYHDIRITPGAAFIKLCDRIANVKYGIMTGSKMVEMYRQEQAHFEKMLNTNPDMNLMFSKLNRLFQIEL